MEWGDLPVFLALARHRTTGRAAKSLGCSQPTVVRRIAAMERALGLTLFNRTTTGFELTATGAQLLPAAERAAVSMQAADDCVAALRKAESAKIKVTLLDQWEGLLVPVLQSHRTRWPGVEVQLLTSYRRFDLAAGEADIALRAGVPFETDNSGAGDEVLVRRMPDVGFGVYVNRYLKPHERPSSPETVARLPMAGGEGNLALLPAIQWFEGLAGPSGIAIRCNGFAAVRAAILQGAVGLLPCLAAGADPALTACFPPPEHLRVPAYLGVRRQALQRPPVRDLFEALSTHVMSQAPLMDGRDSIDTGCC
jgi:DNA-binding transcriptional LysR family regulator